jgi:DNA invertase Pin-like site-specific DNA recombinase
VAEDRRRLRCAIYARKSSEEGLEQSFNSLDAQREACAAYIESQRHEGWKVFDAHYDDGGYSGGTMDRPGLQQLLADIGARKVDVVVVYKVDRLTRSLADFAKIVELFDAHGVSFVSVTQQFNTTSSMGRLTLNVLLSFAQFEREVTGERIRDKIAASKKKGMWMGGNVPLGYNLKDRKLVVDPREAEIVRRIYRRYLELGCVRKLMYDLKAKGIRSKRRVSHAGRASGGCLYSRGALYDILRNRLYLGEIAHRGAVYAGEQRAIVSKESWDKVRALLEANGQARRVGLKAKAPSLLAGLLYDEKGYRFTPLHSTKNGKRYQYYASQAVIRNGPGSGNGVARIPAHEIERLVTRRLQTFVSSPADLLDVVAMPQDSSTLRQAMVRAGKEKGASWSKLAPSDLRIFLLRAVSKIVIAEVEVTIGLSPQGLRAVLLGEKPSKSLASTGPKNPGNARDEIVLRIEAHFERVKGEIRIIPPDDSRENTPTRPDPALLKAIARARLWYEMLVSGQTKSLRGIATVTGVDERYVSRVIRCAFLAPDIVESVIDGKQLPSATVGALFRDVPIEWNKQRVAITG